MYATAIEGVKSLGGFAIQLPAFGVGLTAFIAQAKLITYTEDDAKHVDNVIAVATSLAELENSLDGKGGLDDAIEGVKSLEAFGTNIANFAPGLNSFITQAKQIVYDPEKDKPFIDSIVDIARSLAGFEKELEPYGGWADSIFGTKDLGLFARNMTSFGIAIASYMTNVQGVKIDDSTNATNVAKSIETFIDGLEPSGSVWQKLADVFGEGSKIATLSTYTDAFRQFGTDLEAFSTAMTVVKANQPDFSFVKTLFEGMKTFIEGLDPSGNMWEWFPKTFGEGSKFETLADVANAMGKFGTNLKAFNEGVAGVEVATTRFEAAKRLFEAFKDYNNETKDWKDFEYAQQFGTLFWVMEDFGKSLYLFSENSYGVNVEAVTAAANLVSSIVYAFETVTSLPDFSVAPIQTMLDNFSQITVPEFDTEGMESAKAFIDSLSAGLEDGSAVLALTTAITGLSASGSSAADGTYSTWFTSGQYLAAGLSAGINSMAATVRNSAVSVAAGAIRSIRMTWSVHSPSKVGEDLGMYFDLGLAGGLDSYAKIVSKNAANVGEGAVESAKTMLRGIDGSIFDNLDPNPTIRPVVDLSNIQNGVGVINDMLCFKQLAPIGLFKGLNSVKGINGLNFDGNKIVGGLSDRNIVSKLDYLTGRIGELGEAVTNMKIVLDSGELIGATTRKIDDSLGTLSMRKGRGN